MSTVQHGIAVNKEKAFSLGFFRGHEA